MRKHETPCVAHIFVRAIVFVGQIFRFLRGLHRARFVPLYFTARGWVNILHVVLDY